MLTSAASGFSFSQIKENIMAGESGNVFRRTKVKKTTQEFPNELEAEDIISSLPDSLLLHILSFISTKEVVRTCLLSKRWQFVWTGISEVDLRDDGRGIAKTRNFVDWVGRMLAMCGGLHLNKFAVCLWYENCFASNVNFWVHFAVKNKVKDITLRCICIYYDGMYVLPQILYSYSSLKSLTVGYCVIAPRGAIDWGSLKSLSIFHVELLNCVMEKILSGCPVLEVLHLEGCFGLNCLNIRSPNLTTLTIKDGGFHDNDDDDKFFLEISAPYLRDLTISCNFEEIMFKIRNLSSVVRASFLFSVDEDWEIYMNPDITNYIKQLLESLQSLKELELRPWCIEIFSMLEMKGWKLTPSLLCLTLTPCRNRGSIPGILGFLKSSPNLNTLVIRGSRVSDDEIYVTQDQVAAYLQNGDLDLVLFHLKTIKIIGFQGLVSEPMLMFLQVLLKSAKVLETMVISAEEESIETSSTNTTSTDLAKFASKMVALPKASPKAVVLVC